MTQPYTLAGATVGICVTVQNADLADDDAFAALTYVPIDRVGNIGAYGYDTNLVSYPTLDRLLTIMAKGATSGGTMTIQCADDVANAGQVALIAAGSPTTSANYAFKITYSTGRIDYVRGPVSGPNNPGGGNEAFALLDFKVGVNQIIRAAP